jgi:ABC-type Fe3+-citrate transport system substrate-binding protein
MKRVTSITSALLLLIFTSCNSNPESRLQNEREEITELLGKMKVNSDSDRIEQERIEQEKKDEEDKGALPNPGNGG